MKSLKKLYLLIIFIFVFCLIGCGKGNVVAITVQNLDGKTFELGEGLNFDDAFITIVYENGDRENISITEDNLDALDLLEIYNSLGEKELMISYVTEDGEVFTDEVKIYIVEKDYKISFKNLLNTYNEDVIYSDDALDIVYEIKLVYCNYINNASSYDEAKELYDYAVIKIEKVLTLEEEEKLYSLEEVTEKINDLTEKVNIFINYEDSLFKDEVENLKTKVEELKNNLKDEEVYQEIELINVALTALESNINNLENVVSNNTQRIEALTNLLNTVLGNFVSKEEMNNAINGVTEGYLEAITNTFDSQKYIAELRVNEGYIEYRYNNSASFEKLVSLSELNGQTIENVSVENEEVILLLADETEIETGVLVNTLSNEEVDSITSSLEDSEREYVINHIQEYLQVNYHIDNYDYTKLQDVLGSYYSGYVDFVLYTGYDVLKQVESNLVKINAYLENEFLLSDTSITNLLNMENELKKIDSNLNVCKAYFASLLSEGNIDEYTEEVYKNRILVTNSIESAISLYEEALNK